MILKLNYRGKVRTGAKSGKHGPARRSTKGNGDIVRNIRMKWKLS